MTKHLLSFLFVFFTSIQFVQAATFCTYVGNENTTVGTIRIWVNSDTYSGEGVMAQIRYSDGAGGFTYPGFQGGGTYDDTSFPGANFYVDVTYPSGVTSVDVEVANVDPYGSTTPSWAANYSGFVSSITVLLPVELTSFTAKSNKNTINLTWQTAQEINNDFFQIERKTTQSREWEVVGKEQGRGNSDTTVDYQFTDTKPANGVNYYRLKQTDFDGQFEYSEMVSAEVRTTIAIDIFPNPTASELTIITPNDFTEGEIRLFDAMGKMVISSSINDRNYLDLSYLNSGIYFFRLLDEHGNVVAENKVRKL